MTRDILADPAGGRPVVPGSGRLRPLGLSEVRITGGFWGERQRTNAENSLGHIEHRLERAGWVANFDRSRTGAPAADHAGREFSDSEVYKFVEAMAWEFGRSNDSGVNERLTALVDRIAPAQEADGYLNTNFGHPGQRPCYSDLEWGHELYCYGHLLQAAIARVRTHGEDRLFDVARRAADHVCATFGHDGIQGVDGHPEIETALAEFARLTGDQRYLDQAALFVERRGHHSLGDIEFGRSYYQDDVPVRKATRLRGHAVRALYLSAGAVDVAVDTADDDLLRAVAGQWNDTVARRTYLTGGMGSQHLDESFGDDFALPPDRAYAETCAGIGSLMLSWRLLLADGATKYADLMERTLYNIVATSTAVDGRAFFYANTLHQRQAGEPFDASDTSASPATPMRAPWFHVSCCPPNVARTLSALAAYVATADDDGVQIHQYMESEIRTRLPDGRRVHLDVTTEYPCDGQVSVRIVDAEARSWTLSLRVPAWAEGATVTVRGERRHVEPGTATITQVFRQGERIVLDLPVPPRFTVADPRIDAVRGCVAVERGPLVLCAESSDLPADVNLEDLRIETGAGLCAVVPDGHAPVSALAYAQARAVRPGDSSWPYDAPGAEEPADVGNDRPLEVPLVPYHAWANRGPSTMRVWLPTT